MPAPPAPAAPSCADMDSDGDGVNDCDDKCPGSQAGQTIGPDGCPVPVSIDLKGVNFDFDKADAASGCGRDPQRGDRDLQALSGTACRSGRSHRPVRQGRVQPGPVGASRTTVYDYLTSNGVDAARLTGPNGYGESRPLEDLGQDDAGLQEREEPSHRAERPELSYPRLSRDNGRVERRHGVVQRRDWMASVQEARPWPGFFFAVELLVLMRSHPAGCSIPQRRLHCFANEAAERWAMQRALDRFVPVPPRRRGACAICWQLQFACRRRRLPVQPTLLAPASPELSAPMHQLGAPTGVLAQAFR